MLSKIYIYIIILFFKKNLNLNIYSLNLKLNISEKKIILYYFFKLKLNFYKLLHMYNENKYKILHLLPRIQFLTINDESVDFKKINNNTILNTQINILNFNYKLKKINYLFYVYYTFFLKNIIINIDRFNKYFYNVNILKKKMISILIVNSLKENFLKTIELFILSSFLNQKVLMISDEKMEDECLIFNEYSFCISRKKKNSFVILSEPTLKLKYLYKAINLNIPIISVVDNSFELDWVSHPIFIKKINLFSIYFFFLFFINLTFIGQEMNKKKNIIIYNNFLKLLYIKEYLFKNEIL